MNEDVYRFEFRGFLFGGDEPYAIKSIDGLDMPALRTGDVEAPGADGSLMGLDRLEPRLINISYESTGSFDDRKAAANVLFRSDVEYPLRFKLHATAIPQQVNARVNRRNAPVNYNIGWDWQEGDIQFRCSDPLVYSQTLLTAMSMPIEGATGWGYPYSYPWGYGASGSGASVVAENLGTAPAPWMATVTGPAMNPEIVRQGGGRVKFLGNLSATETLVVDAHPHRLSLLLNGTASRYASLSNDSVWFALAPGANGITYQSADGGGVMNLEWRHAWWEATP